MNSDNLLINSIRRYTRFSDEDATVLSEYVIEDSYKRGHYIVREGDVSRYTMFVAKGAIRAYYIDINGHEHIIQLAIEGWWAGDLISFTNQSPGKLYVEALEPTVIYKIAYADLQQLYLKLPALERFYRILFQQAYAAFHTRILENMSMTAENRYVAFKNKYPDMDARIAQKHIASYLGMSAEFLSKIKKRMYKGKKKLTN